MRSHSSLPGSHRHMWLVGVLGLLAGLALMIWVPKLQAISSSMLLFAGFHLFGALIALASLHITWRSRSGRRAKPRSEPSSIDFGWSPAWTFGPLLLAGICWTLAVVAMLAWPAWWPAACLLVLLGGIAFAGFLFTRSSADAEFAPLPLVDLLPGGCGLILDGGCGAGRTSLAVARAYPAARLVALDRFDSSYIDGGGRELLAHNAACAGIGERLQIVSGDLTALQFADASFDAAVSAHAMDHLGRATEQGLAEMWRVLKPGGHFLMVVWVPGWAMFAVANLLSLLLASPAVWRKRVARAGFELLQEGGLNGYRYLLLRKPAVGSAASR